MIEEWLENFHELSSGRLPPSEVPGNSGYTPGDGIRSSQLHLIMLKDAIKKLPIEQRNVVICRYIKRYSRGDTLRLLKLGSNEYYKICDIAKSNIFLTVNGRRSS